MLQRGIWPATRSLDKCSARLGHGVALFAFREAATPALPLLRPLLTTELLRAQQQLSAEKQIDLGDSNEARRRRGRRPKQESPVSLTSTEVVRSAHQHSHAPPRRLGSGEQLFWVVVVFFIQTERAQSWNYWSCEQVREES